MADDNSPSQRVHFVGVGAMGSEMVRHLVDTSIELRITDLDDPRAAQLAEELGASAVAAASLAEAAVDTDIVILMLPATTAVESVLLGDSGLLATLPTGALVIDMGSSDPHATRAHAEAASARGVGFVDAPVSGGVPRARTATLSIMVGGDAVDVERARGILGRLGDDVQHLGGAGAGHAMKALNNLLSAIGLLGASEVLAIGREFGLEPQTMLDVLNRSTGGNHATRVKMARYALSGSFDSAFSLALMVKDLRTATDLAASVGVEAALAQRCLDEWQEADQELGPGADHTHIWAFVERFRTPPQMVVDLDSSSSRPTD